MVYYLLSAVGMSGALVYTTSDVPVCVCVFVFVFVFFVYTLILSGGYSNCFNNTDV